MHVFYHAIQNEGIGFVGMEWEFYSIWMQHLGSFDWKRSVTIWFQYLFLSSKLHLAITIWFQKKNTFCKIKQQHFLH